MLSQEAILRMPGIVFQVTHRVGFMFFGMRSIRWVRIYNVFATGTYKGFMLPIKRPPSVVVFIWIAYVSDHPRA